MSTLRTQESRKDVRAKRSASEGGTLGSGEMYTVNHSGLNHRQADL
jgi:hypothetical protein